MNDNQLFTLVRSVILAGLAAREMSGWRVARKFQPKQTGANSTPTVYLFKIGGDRNHGWPQQKYQWNVEAAEMRAENSQVKESTFQASILMDESDDPEALTPSDAINVVCDIMQSDEGLAALRAQGVGILRVGQVTNPYDVNDRGQFDASPSFDFVLTYRRKRQAKADYAVSVEGRIHRV
jgi:hypothetical protein